VECRKVSLDENFDLDAEAVLESADEWTKVIFLCSPNNPSGNSLDRGSIYKILKNYEGIVVIDEAYIDFSAYPSFLKELSGFPNLIVLQTLSKAWGAAGIRLGMVIRLSGDYRCLAIRSNIRTTSTSLHRRKLWSS